MRNLKNITLLQNDGFLLSSLQRNALASLVHFAHKNELGVEVHCIGGQKEGPHRSIVG